MMTLMKVNEHVKITTLKKGSCTLQYWCSRGSFTVFPKQHSHFSNCRTCRTEDAYCYV